MKISALTIGMARRRSGGAVDVDPTDANLSAVAVNGWEATYASPPTFDPVADPKYLRVSRAGHDSAGASATVTDDLLVMSRVRQAYPTETSWTTDSVALQNFVYATDTTPAGVTNNSTRAAPVPHAVWLRPDMDVATGQAYTAKLFVSHAHARHGRPVAAVKFILTDGSANSVETAKITTMTSTAYTASGLTVPHFEGTFADLSSLDDDTALTLDVVIYPWVGAEYQASVDGATYPSSNFTTMRIFNWVSYGAAYAYVDPTSGDDGTAVVSATPATAAASPYLTLGAADDAIQTFNNSNYSRNNANGGTIRLVADTTTVNAPINPTISADGPPLVIEAADVADKATTILTDRGTTISTVSSSNLLFRNLTVKRTTNSVFVIHFGSGDPTGLVSFENCTFDENGGTFYGAWIYRVGRLYAIDCATGGKPFSFISPANHAKQATIIGCSGEPGHWYTAVGCNMSSGFNLSSWTGAALEEHAAVICAFSFVSNAVTGNPILKIGTKTPADGCSIVGTILEDQDGTTSSTLFLSGDSDAFTQSNFVVQMTNVLGERTNAFYNDTSALAKSGYVRFSVFSEYNMKSDVQATDGTYIGNWPAIYKVGSHSNVYLAGSADGESTFDVGHWCGEIGGIGELVGSGATPIVADWTSDKSADGDGLGGGDYTPGASTALPTYGDTALLPYSVDQNGNTLTSASYIGAIGG